MQFKSDPKQIIELRLHLKVHIKVGTKTDIHIFLLYKTNKLTNTKWQNNNNYVQVKAYGSKFGVSQKRLC